ncbi:MAG TPA: ester cyclase [Candidatus Saccharimonadales bacterium]|jgi:predicted ester cyclase|nr:ester cyclase [Candidatus Saccharimonadales bacterium]
MTQQIEDNKNRIQKLFKTIDESLASGDYTKLDEFYTPDSATRTHPRSTYQAPETAAEKKDTRAERHAQLDAARASFGERKHAVVMQIAEGDFVMSYLDVTLKHTGVFAGITPTGKTIREKQIFIHRLTNGRVVETWSEGNILGIFRQLGMIPLGA